MKPTDQIMLKSFPKDERLKLPLHKGVFNWVARQPLAPVVGLAAGTSSSPQEFLIKSVALTATCVAASIYAWKKHDITPHSLSGQWHDRAVNRLLAKQNKDGTAQYSENHPKVMEHMMHAAAHRAGHANFNGYNRILG